MSLNIIIYFFYKNYYYVSGLRSSNAYAEGVKLLISLHGMLNKSNEAPRQQQL